MCWNYYFLVSLIFASFAQIGFSETSSADDQAVQEALGLTQKALSDPAQRSKIIQSSPAAKQTNKGVEALMGNAENTQKLYEMAADVMQTLVKLSDGDPDKMMKILEKAQKDPESFAKTFTKKQLSMLRELAKKVETPKAMP